MHRSHFTTKQKPARSLDSILTRKNIHIHTWQRAGEQWKLQLQNTEREKKQTIWITNWRTVEGRHTHTNRHWSTSYLNVQNKRKLKWIEAEMNFDEIIFISRRYCYKIIATWKYIWKRREREKEKWTASSKCTVFYCIISVLVLLSFFFYCYLHKTDRSKSKKRA